MVLPSETLLLHNGHGHSRSGFGGCNNGFGLMRLIQSHEGFDVTDEVCLKSDHHKEVDKRINHCCSIDNHMADQEKSRPDDNRRDGSSSKDDNYTNFTNSNANLNQEEMREEGWLQLSIGGHTETKREDEHQTDLDQHHDGIQVDPTAKTDQLLELNLFSRASNIFNSPATNTNDFGPLGLRPPLIPQNVLVNNSSSSSSSYLPPLMGPYLSRPVQSPLIGSYNYTDPIVASSSDFRVIDPPRRSHSGIWFLLQASPNQAKAPFLPQITKNYLRIRDGKMTVRLLQKYLANKLQLDNESKIEIRCKGQQLESCLTLEHVRDTIWSPRDHSCHPIALAPRLSTTDRVMVLHYGRTP